METPATYKLISVDQHGLVGYAFGIAAATVPTLLGADKKVIRIYEGVALQVLLYGALSKHRYAIKPLIPSNIHLAIGIANLAGLALLSGYRKVKKDKKSLSFNLALLGIGIANVVLTNWTGKASS